MPLRRPRAQASASPAGRSRRSTRFAGHRYQQTLTCPSRQHPGTGPPVDKAINANFTPQLLELAAAGGALFQMLFERHALVTVQHAQGAK
jgi:hypothetical protein